MSFDKALIIEDEPVVRNMLSEIFFRKKCTVQAAKTLSEAEALVACTIAALAGLLGIGRRNRKSALR